MSVAIYSARSVGGCSQRENRISLFSTNNLEILMENIFMKFVPALERVDLLSATVAEYLQDYLGSVAVENIKVAEIDPTYAGGADLCERYSIPTEEGANCVVVEAVRAGLSQFAVCVIPVNCKIDLNKKVRKILNARKVSLAAKDKVLFETKMEYGSITPVGLPESWPILIDESLIGLPRVIVGSGKLHAKLSLPGKALEELLNAQVINELGVKLS